MASDEKRPIGKILLQRKLVSQSELDASLRTQRQSDKPEPLASQLVEEGKIDEVEALRALSEQYGVPGIDLAQVAIVLDQLSVVPRDLAEAHRILPVLVRGDRIFLAMADPKARRVIDELEFVTGKKVYAYNAMHNTLVKAIAQAYDAKDRGERHYLGPRVPEETLRQLGLAPPAPTPDAPAPAPIPPPRNDPVAMSGPVAGANKAVAPPIPATAAAANKPAPPPLPPAAGANKPAPPAIPSAAANKPAPPAIPSAAANKPAPPPPATGANKPAPPTIPSATADANEPISRRPPLVVDEAVASAARTSELSTTEFGIVDEEISSVSNLPADMRAGASRAAVATAAEAGAGKLILVVDDDDEIRKLLKRLLTQKGHRVIEADRGLLALRLVKDHVPDLIMLDAMLPELHGFDIARRIKGSAKYGRIPVIMMSAVYRGWRIAEDLRQNYGIEEYLEKPFRISDVLEMVQRLLARSAGAAPEGRDPEYLSGEAEKALIDGVAAYKGGDIDGAIEHLRRGVSIDPLAYRLRFHLGLLYGKKGQVYDGVQELERAIDLNPRHFAALKNLAVLYEKAGFKNKAVEMWERCVAVAPDEGSRASIRERLRELI
jgi:DNA-binding response OmpR family regulator